MDDVIKQKNNNEMFTMVQEFERIINKLINVKHYYKYKEIISKFDTKIFSCSGLTDLGKFEKVVEESINIFESYEFQEDIELKEFMNKKQDELKEILKRINDIEKLN